MVINSISLLNNHDVPSPVREIENTMRKIKSLPCRSLYAGIAGDSDHDGYLNMKLFKKICEPEICIQ